MQHQYQSWKKNKWYYVTAAAVVAVAWWSFGGSESDNRARNEDITNVVVTRADRQDVPIQLSLVGTVVARESVAVRSRIDSQVTRVLFNDGDDVNEGQPLFELDDRTIKANLSELQADLAKEEAQLVNVKRQYERAQKLLKTNVVAQAQVDEAKASYEAQLAQVEASRATLDNAAVQLSYTAINAPISGRTGTINVTRGNTVKANDAQPLVTINQISPIRVQFAIPQRYYAQVKTGMTQHSGLTIHAKHAESQETQVGKLEYIDNAIDTSSGTFAARASFDNKNEALWPGMFVNVTLDLGIEKNALTVPAVAIQGDENKRFVYKVEGPPDKAVKTPVETEVTSGNTTIISSGLQENDRIVTDGMLRLIDGALVNVTEETDVKAASDNP